MQRSRIVRSAVTLTALTLVAGAGAYALHGGRSTPTAVSPRLGLAAYRSFSGCDDLLSYLRTQALPLVGPFGLDGQSVPGGPVGLRGVAPGALPRAADGAGSTTAGPIGAAASSGAEPSGATSATGTNIQVAGVDEADVTKKSGDLVLTVAAGAHTGLTVLRASDRQVRVIGRLATDWSPQQLLVQGTTVLLLGAVPENRRPGPIPAPSTPGGSTRLVPLPTDQPKVRVAEVDVADPAQPRLVRTLDLDGGLVGARLAGGVVRLAVAATPSRLPFGPAPDVPERDRPAGRCRCRLGPGREPPRRTHRPGHRLAATLDPHPGGRERLERQPPRLRPRRRAHGVLRARHARDADVRPALRRRRPLGRRRRRREWHDPLLDR